jgi:uncharacterized membrane protein (UPF0182 family)
MSDFGFDPADLFKKRPPGRGPRVVRSGPRLPRRRRILIVTAAVLIAVLLVAFSLVDLRVQFIFLDNLDHTNVFWTPLLAKIVLFIIGFLLCGALVALNIPGFAAAAGSLDRYGGRIAVYAGIALAVVSGIVAGAWLAGQWQDVLLWQHHHDFGSTDPVFHRDYSFFLFTLPVLDDLQGIAWGAAIVGLLGAIGLAGLCVAVETAPEEVPMPLRPPVGRTPRDGMEAAVRHAGMVLVAIFVLAALGSHYGVFHLATSDHSSFIGLDAVERNVLRPVLGALQWIALVFALATVALLVVMRGSSAYRAAAVFGGMLAGWLLLAGLAQGVPTAIYRATSVNPNALTAQRASIADFLTTSRAAWALEPDRDVKTTQFGTPPGSPPAPPSVADLLADPGTTKNVRIWDFRVLQEVFNQIDRSRSYQTFPSITVDRYPSPSGETQVMLSSREVAEADIPAGSFVNRSFIYTHGYGITAVSVNRVGAEGKPDILAGHQPLEVVAPDAPPDLAVKDPRLYCGLATTQPVVVNTTQKEFDYPSQNGDQTARFGDLPGGIRNPGGLDRLAISLSAFKGFDLFLTSALTADSRVLLHREVRDRINQLAPFLRLDGDPYVVADPATGHLQLVADAYVTSDRFPEAFRQGDGTSYMRNAVKAVIDARTCQTTLYAVDPSEPLTATYNEIYPGLFQPLDRMPATLRSHLRYPEDLFKAQAQAYGSVHITDPDVLFNRSDLFRVAQEILEGNTQDTQPYYVELTLPGDKGASFVLLQAFSPAQSSGGGAGSNVMTALMAARCDYTTGQPKLVAIRLNNADNVLGPLQFDNNINTDPVISPEITLLNTGGSHVFLGNVIVLPFNGHSFLYVRPLFVQAAGGSFPQLRYVIVGTQGRIAQGTSLPDALQNLFGQPIPLPGLGTTTGPPPSPGASPTPQPGGTGLVLPPQVLTIVQDLIQHNTNAQQAIARGDYVTYGKEQDAVQKDLDKLRQLLGSGANVVPSPSASASPGASASPR